MSEFNIPIVAIDDEEPALSGYLSILKLNGFTNLTGCADSRKALAVVHEVKPRVVLLDLMMPHVSGLELLPEIRKMDAAVIIITADHQVESAVKCMKLGALDYLIKPIEKGALVAAVRQVAGKLGEGSESDLQAFEKITSTSAAMLPVCRRAALIAPSPNPVLIAGETGTGKELLARAIHDASGRTGEFVTVNVAGLDDAAFSEAIFGCAATDGPAPCGLIERARNGTLFLDEVGDLSLGAQAKIMRVIETREYFPLDGCNARKTDARIVGATSKDLEELHNKGALRSDLYYRFSCHVLAVLPLRERKEDIVPLAEHFINKAAAVLGRPAPRVESETLMSLSQYDFPGNIRELEGRLFDAVIQSGEKPLSSASFREIFSQPRTEHAPLPLSGGPISFGEKLPSLKEIKRLLFEEAMRRAGGNRTAAASMLGISRQGLHYWSSSAEEDK